ncbi:MAG TPA: flagellar hook-associated protein 3 [Anaerolineae bacterium]|nr:flagellar hook-associated protein 3 [Anaerolineae bacterium]HIQ06341.1 flagellar hook-associated protein 3 [Anaerolineae bacterium]
MMTRITERMLVNSFLDSLRSRLTHLQDAQDRVSTGKRLRQPRDDPAGMERALSLHSHLAQTTERLQTLGLSREWLGASETALGQLADVLSRARALAQSATNVSLSATERTSLADQAQTLLEDTLSIANSKYGDRFLFAGFQTTTQPFTLDEGPPTAVVYHGDGGLIRHEIETGTQIAVNVPGNHPLFTLGFDALINLRDMLLADDVAGIRSTLDDLDEAMEQAVAARSSLGARVQRLTSAESRLRQLQTDLQSALSRIEDADMAEAISNLMQQEQAYQATLASGARIIQPTLLDYLR